LESIVFGERKKPS